MITQPSARILERMNARDLTALIHLVGFGTGIILYAMLGMMTRRRLSYVDVPSDRLTVDRVPMFAAVLGVIWNGGAMLVYAVRDFGIAEPLPWVGAVAYSALGFLPAVVVHSALNRTRPAEHRWLLIVAYAGSGAAALMHFGAAARGDMLSSTGLLLLTITYAGVLGVLAVTERRRPGFQRSITAVALAAFAVSALHLSQHAVGLDQDPWPIELIGHHASLPLVLAILYQDFRFAFADLFLKRALSLLVLVCVVALLYATLAAPMLDPRALAASGNADDGRRLISAASILTLWIATALAYPFIQRRTFHFVDRVVLRRVDYRELRAEVARRLPPARDAESAIQLACGLLADALDASLARWRVALVPTVAGHPTITVDARRSEACIVVPTAVAPAYEIVVGGLRGGRTLFSDDLVLMDGVAASLGRRIDEIRLEAERFEHDRREREVLRLATEAELRALRAQLNPHFLFNALNTLGHLMQTAPDRAQATLYQLTGLLRAVLRRTNGQFVALREELEIVESYLAIEGARFDERLIVTVDVPPHIRHARVPPLILQPLVENAVKHGIAPMRAGGSVTVRGRRTGSAGGADDRLQILVIDSGRGIQLDERAGDEGVGLANINARLRLYYGEGATMSLHVTPGGGTTVDIRLPWSEADHVVPARAG